MSINSSEPQFRTAQTKVTRDPCLCGHSMEHHKNLDRCSADGCGCRRYDAEWNRDELDAPFSEDPLEIHNP